jgi:hypothetical protein
LRQDAVQHLPHRVGGERRLQREALVQHGAEREHVAARIERQALHLLGRHVLRRASDGAHRGDRHRGLVARQTEVGQHRAAVGAQDDVGRLDVAVHEAAGVRMVEGSGDLRDHLHQGAQRRRGVPAAFAQLLQVPIERQALDELHRQPVHALGRADVVDADDVRVMQAGQRQCLAAQACQRCRVVAHVGAQHLERDAAVERELARLVDDPHAAAPDLAQDLEVAEHARGRQRVGVLFAVSRHGRQQVAQVRVRGQQVGERPTALAVAQPCNRGTLEAGT